MSLNVSDLVKRVSIRARVAYGLKYLEKCIISEDIESNEIIMNWFLDELWSYTDSDRLDSWQMKMDALCPEVLLKEGIINDDFLKAGKNLIKLYKNLSKVTLDIIDQIILTGVYNLYAGTGSFGENSHYHTMNVVKLMEYNNKVLVDINGFLVYPFSEEKGWGRKFKRTEIESIFS